MHADYQKVVSQKSIRELSWNFQGMLKGEDQFTKRQCADNTTDTTSITTNTTTTTPAATSISNTTTTKMENSWFVEGKFE